MYVDYCTYWCRASGYYEDALQPTTWTSLQTNSSEYSVHAHPSLLNPHNDDFPNNFALLAKALLVGLRHVFPAIRGGEGDPVLATVGTGAVQVTGVHHTQPPQIGVVVGEGASKGRLDVFAPLQECESVLSFGRLLDVLEEGVQLLGDHQQRHLQTLHALHKQRVHDLLGGILLLFLLLVEIRLMYVPKCPRLTD
jgi:hypothetical protein